MGDADDAYILALLAEPAARLNGVLAVAVTWIARHFAAEALEGQKQALIFLPVASAKILDVALRRAEPFVSSIAQRLAAHRTDLERGDLFAQVGDRRLVRLPCLGKLVAGASSIALLLSVLEHCVLVAYELMRGEIRLADRMSGRGPKARTAYLLRLLDVTLGGPQALA